MSQLTYDYGSQQLAERAHSSVVRTMNSKSRTKQTSFAYTPQYSSFKSPYSSSSSGSSINLYHASLHQKKKLYMDQYTKRQATPHPSKYMSVFCASAPKLKPKEVEAKEIHQNDPYYKGSLLTYWCHPCNKCHEFHKTDVIVSDGFNYYSSEESEISPLTGNVDKDNTGASDLSTVGTASSLPVINFSFEEIVCCADHRCNLPKGLTATVLCYDCHDDFHQNLCGDLVYLLDQPTGITVGCQLCYKCIDICSVGRESCKHPGDMEGLVVCNKCKKNFHYKVCGGEKYKVFDTTYIPEKLVLAGYLCNVCLASLQMLDTPDRDKRKRLMSYDTERKKLYCNNNENNVNL